MPTYESLPPESEFFKGNIFQKMVDDLRLAGKAKRTVYGYLRAVRQMADFCEKSPDQMFEQDGSTIIGHQKRRGSTRSEGTKSQQGTKMFQAEHHHTAQPTGLLEQRI